ncbi:tRNA (adenosine(37)-N6)-threonylcarbamoyltransferase complex dimerization subunit type 1 TsaB [Sphingomonas donggukensis]|uniref:tRNA (Adenosine(37)-N6)-threonylcarbamoyltransferase complex dimerization subunit type 1 TsaB n=1 Tax=Sphingomonas donggukensis TaxID=2949093 RepID=A0ABY4TXW4_9SPHN|nr:tRNA (adenosine(37)-N6)-threonylcarbamoyltransferase complex dimerization subunit type 1 TsaB [Sphingomonas donggukensis]URW75148.1 tRNA (adenosine(37)-N6)-threonylcarbamoyltransferase complex dimerization subunit type 1 TsaB [Sphingomonas donggukensis]
MRTLVIDTATAACSVALIADGVVVAALHEVVGRGHAERLVPMIAELPDGGKADAVLVDCGPGSFTGLRVGLAAAIGLGIGWGVPVSGYASTSLIAAAAFADHPDVPALAVVIEGGHGEVFMQRFDPALAAAPLASLKPDAALVALGGEFAVGSGLGRLAAFDPAIAGVDALPVAARATLLPPHLTALPPRPIYGRAPDAKPAAVKPA